MTISVIPLFIYSSETSERLKMIRLGKIYTYENY